MTWMLVAIAGWLTVAVLVGLFAWGLARAAAMADQVELEQVDQRAVEGEAIRPWAVDATGGRAEDALRRDLAEAHRVLRNAETRLAEIEARQSA